MTYNNAYELTEIVYLLFIIVYKEGFQDQCFLIYCNHNCIIIFDKLNFKYQFIFNCTYHELFLKYCVGF